MNNFIPEEAREGLIKANADASGEIDAVLMRNAVAERLRQRNAIHLVLDNTCQTVPIIENTEREIA